MRANRVLTLSVNELASGKRDVLTGPINDPSGAVMVPAGKRLTDPALQRMNRYVQGGDGGLPK
jgi:hypothetical protein